LLRESGIDIKKRFDDGLVQIFKAACQGGHFEIIRYFCEGNYQIDISVPWGKPTPFRDLDIPYHAMMQPKVLENLTLFLYLESQIPEAFTKSKGIESAVVLNPQVSIWRWLKDKGHKLAPSKLLDSVTSKNLRAFRVSHEQEEHHIDFDSYIDEFARNIMECFELFRVDDLVQSASQLFESSAAWATPHQAVYIYTLNTRSDPPLFADSWARWSEVFLERADYVDPQDMNVLLGRLPSDRVPRRYLRDVVLLKNSIEVLDMLTAHFGEEHMIEALTPSAVEEILAVLLRPFEFEDNKFLNSPSPLSVQNSFAVNIGRLQYDHYLRIVSRHKMRPQYQNVLRVIEWLGDKGIELTKEQLEVFRGVRHPLFRVGLEKLLQTDTDGRASRSSCIIG